MRKSRFSAEQIAYALRQAEQGTPVASLCRKMGVSQQTFYVGKRRFGGMGVAELRKVKQLEDEVRRLKQLVADLALDKQMLQEVLANSRKPLARTSVAKLSPNLRALRGTWRHIGAPRRTSGTARNDSRIRENWCAVAGLPSGHPFAFKSCLPDF
jgi:putative transposase